ncbi:MAG: hypothetical protein ACI857_001938 [Arenicella sp.]|jgi:hypothetical protein
MKSLNALLLIILTSALSSCFEIIEDVSINEDGSGKFRYIVNFSQSAPKIKSLLLMDEVDGVAVPTEAVMKSKFDAACQITKKAQGISDVSFASDFDDYIFTYQCNFKNTTSLNLAIDSVKNHLGDDNLGYQYFNYQTTPKKFNRVGDDLIVNLWRKMSTSQRLIFVGAKYTCLYRFFDEISTFDSIGSKLSADKKTSFKLMYMSGMINNGHLIDQEIILK